MTRRSRRILIALLVLFVAVRVPGLSIPYQQDEFKTAIAAESGLSEASAFLTHPPLTAVLFYADAQLFGGDHMRLVPLFFGIVSAGLLFAVVRRRFSERDALWSVFLYAISFYGVWSSLMLDTDGAILPTFLLAALYSYDRWRERGAYATRWMIVLMLALVVGFLVKLSFILVALALMADFAFERRKEFSIRHVISFGVAGFVFALLVATAFVAATCFNSAFSMSDMVSHALYYVHWSGRSYLQSIIQTLKAVFYLSPLLLAPLILVPKEVLRKATPFLWYLGWGFVFYFVLFDFSRGALDKYLMFTIIPVSVLSGATLSRIFASFSFQGNARSIVAGTIAAAAIIGLVYITPEIVPLYPKTMWFSRVIQGDWNVLTAFNGGSGPVGFYMSFLVIAISFIVAGAAALAGCMRESWRRAAAVLIVCVGMAYNGIFIEEFSFGKVYGSTSNALQAALVYIAGEPDITRVNTHNDIGAYELKHLGKYGTHFTAAPQFEGLARSVFPAYAGAFLVVDIPPLYDGFYRDFFNSCKILFTTQSGVITSSVYSSCTWTQE